MPLWAQIVLWAAVAAAAVHFIIYTAKNDRYNVIEIDEDFELRYPRPFLYLCVVALLFAGGLAVNLFLSRSFTLPALLFLIVFVALAVPLLLLSAVWRVYVRAEYIIYRSPLGVKRQIYYKDIQSATLTRRSLILKTTLKTYKFYPGITYLEYFLKRLSMNGVKVERYP